MLRVYLKGFLYNLISLLVFLVFICKDCAVIGWLIQMGSILHSDVVVGSCPIEFPSFGINYSKVVECFRMLLIETNAKLKALVCSPKISDV